MSDHDDMSVATVSESGHTRPLAGIRVLLVSYENDGCAIAEFARALRDDGADVHVVVGDQHSLIRIRSWEKRLIADQIPYTTLNRAFEAVKAGDVHPDQSWIEEFEKNRLKNKTFGELMMTDPMLSRQHHHRRPYYKLMSGSESYMWAERLAKIAVDVFDSFSPDAVVTIERNYFVKNALAQVAMRSGTRVLSYIPCRVGQYGVWVDQFGFADSQEALFYSSEKGQNDYSNGSCGNEILLRIDNFIFQNEKGLYSANSHKKRSVREGVGKIIRGYISREARSFRRLIEHTSAAIRGKTRRWTTPLAGKFLYVRAFSAIVMYRTLRAEVQRIYDASPNGERFVMFPLHVMPESSTLTLGPEYYEVDIIRRLSHMMPAGLVLLVKENPNMVGLRTKRERDLLRELPNVYYVSPWEEMRELLRRCAGVAGISGTALLEGALLGKPTLALGRPEFAAALSHQGISEASRFFSYCQTEASAKAFAERAYEYVQAMASVAVGGVPAAIAAESKAVEHATRERDYQTANVYVALKGCLAQGKASDASMVTAVDKAKPRVARD